MPYIIHESHWLSSKETAKRLCISPNTLRNERSRARRDEKIKHPIYLSLGTETIYLEESVEDHVRKGRRA